jgi:hypothetical protein
MAPGFRMPTQENPGGAKAHAGIRMFGTRVGRQYGGQISRGRPRPLIGLP